MSGDHELAERPTAEIQHTAPATLGETRPAIGNGGAGTSDLAGHVASVLASPGPPISTTPGAGRIQRSPQTGQPTADDPPAQQRLHRVDAATIANTPLARIQSIKADELDGEAYRVLHDGMHQSWNEAKHVLAAGKLPDGPTTPDQSAALKAMMQKLWDYRQWHHELVLQDTRRRVNAMTNDPEGLKEWKAAGSTSLTSDIDVNLKGNHTELAVKVFNETFKEFGWTYEAGVVYDVNVYAVDFMHGMGHEGAGGLVVSQEGRRAGRAEGGVENPLDAEADQSQQRIWTLVKTRLYMTPKEWADFKDASGGNGWDQGTFVEAERRFEQFRSELTGAMGAEVRQTIDAAEQTERTGAEAIHAAAEARTTQGGNAEDVAMAASNRVYEAKLAEVAEYRKALALAMANYHALMAPSTAPPKPGQGDDIQALRQQIDMLLVMLRDLLSECSLFANEAYLTHGAVNHGVVGLQIGKPIAMTNSAMYDAFQENLADALKEMARHGGSLGEAAYKSGKYIWRMADAADNLGVDVEEKRWMLTAGGKIANEVKNAGGDTEAASARLVEQWLGVHTVAELRQAVIGFGMVVGAQYNERIREQQRSGANSRPVDKGNWKR
jgi:hypothetical protein